jgi:hypothetical protein
LSDAAFAYDPVARGVVKLRDRADSHYWIPVPPCQHAG